MLRERVEFLLTSIKGVSQAGSEHKLFRSSDTDEVLELVSVLVVRRAVREVLFRPPPPSNLEAHLALMEDTL